MSTTIYEVLDELRGAATSEADKGSKLEQLMLAYLRTDPVYAEQFSDVWLWQGPDEAYRYMLGSRSAVEWIIDRYQVKTDKASGIVNDPNDWSREVGYPRYILDLLARIVTVSLETMAIVDGLPALEVRGDS